MNNQRSSSDQILRFVLLFMAAMALSRFLAPSNKAPVASRPSHTLAEAFAGIDKMPPATVAGIATAPRASADVTSRQAAARIEVAKLKKDISDNNGDSYSYWARLRAGLLDQYLLDDQDAAIVEYDELNKYAAHDDLNAQAMYQKGDILWQKAHPAPGSTAPPDALADSAKAFNQMVQANRETPTVLTVRYWAGLVGRAGPLQPAFRDLQIYLPQASRPDALHGSTLNFALLPVGQVLQSNGNPNPPGVLDRVLAYYSTTPLYKVLDFGVRLFGSNPQYSYGLALIGFALMTRLLLQPLTKKQYESMKGMQLIAPEMKKIQDKYKGKNEQQGQMMKELRELQSKHGVNPMLGCGLALVQMPIFFFVVYPMINNYEPRMVEVGASFLWVRSLAQPDIVLLLAYAVSMFFSFRLSSVPATDETQRQQQAMMAYVFPIMFPLFLKSYPSAFTMYWMTFNMLNTIFQWRMMKHADPTKSMVKTLMGTAPQPLAASAVATIPARPAKLAASSNGVAGEVTTAGRIPRRPRPTSGSLEGGTDGSGGAFNGTTYEVDGAPVATSNGTSGASPRSGGNNRTRRRRRH